MSRNERRTVTVESREFIIQRAEEKTIDEIIRWDIFRPDNNFHYGFMARLDNPPRVVENRWHVEGRWRFRFRIGFSPKDYIAGEVRTREQCLQLLAKVL